MTTITEVQTTQVYQVFIKATPEQIWDAITKPEFTRAVLPRRAAHDHAATTTRRSARTASVWGDADVFEFDPPRKLSHGWRSLYSEELAPRRRAASRGRSSRATTASACSRSSTTGSRARRRRRRASSGAGWMGVLSGLKTLLETGESL